MSSAEEMPLQVAEPIPEPIPVTSPHLEVIEGGDQPTAETSQAHPHLQVVEGGPQGSNLEKALEWVNDLHHNRTSLTPQEQDQLRAMCQHLSGPEFDNLGWIDAAWRLLLTTEERNKLRQLQSDHLAQCRNVPYRAFPRTPEHLSLLRKMGYDTETYFLTPESDAVHVQNEKARYEERVAASAKRRADELASRTTLQKVRDWLQEPPTWGKSKAGKSGRPRHP